ncbi:MAG: hypothetical protein H0T59_09370 [Chloroflexi bacterium]|nr:hypothetical protein [Chloroflexota bacterium]
MPAPFPDLATTGQVGAGATGQNGTHGITAQHDVNGSAHAANGHAGDDEFDAVARLDSISAPPTDDHVAASTSTSSTDKTTSQTGGLLRRFHPGTNLDAELEAYERERVEVDPVELIGVDVEFEPEPEVAAAAEPEFEPEPEVAAAAEPESELIAAVEPEPEVVAVAAEPDPEPAPSPGLPTDVIPQPTWRMTAPDRGQEGVAADEGKPAEDIAAAAVKARPPAEPQWPPRPEWLGGEPSVGLPFLGRPNAPQGGLDAIWAESDRAVAAASAARGKPAAAGGVQPCVSCGLSLSATARFCRRCGTHRPG